MRERADQLLVKRGLVRSRARAQDEIKAGHVRADGQIIDKPGALIAADAEITIENENPFVSRGALKLAHALDHFEIDPTDKTVLDIGASTGGFTQLCLARGAAKVYAVDVGEGQLAPELQNDSRIVQLPKTDARSLTKAVIDTAPDLIVCDVSFISLEKALTAALDLAAPQAILVALIKPQFEAGREHIASGGIVRSAEIRHEVVARIRDWLNEQPGWRVQGVIESPIEGGDGNREYLAAAQRI